MHVTGMKILFLLFMQIECRKEMAQKQSLYKKDVQKLIEELIIKDEQDAKREKEQNKQKLDQWVQTWIEMMIFKIMIPLRKLEYSYQINWTSKVKRYTQAEHLAALKKELKTLDWYFHWDDDETSCFISYRTT